MSLGALVLILKFRRLAELLSRLHCWSLWIASHLTTLLFETPVHIQTSITQAGFQMLSSKGRGFLQIIFFIHQPHMVASDALKHPMCHQIPLFRHRTKDSDR